MGVVGREHCFQDRRSVDLPLMVGLAWCPRGGWWSRQNPVWELQNRSPHSGCDLWMQVVCAWEKGSKDSFMGEMPGILEIFVPVVPPSVSFGFEAHSKHPSYQCPLCSLSSFPVSLFSLPHLCFLRSSPK